MTVMKPTRHQSNPPSPSITPEPNAPQRQRKAQESISGQSVRMRKAPKLPCASEHIEQAALFAWAGLQSNRIPELALMFAVPNGARTSWSTAKKLKAEGLRTGVPDVWLPVARTGFHGLVIEMKRQRDSQVSAEQKDWLSQLANQGYCAVVAHGWDEAREAILRYLEEQL